MPASADDFTFNIGGTYTVSWTAGVATSRTHTCRSGTVRHNVASPHTATTGITMGGIINNTGANVRGSRIHFGATGGYTGSGACATEITSVPAAQTTATGPLNVGKIVPAGIDYDGTLDVGTQNVTLFDSSGAALGGWIRISSGGNLSVPSGLGVQLAAGCKARAP